MKADTLNNIKNIVSYIPVLGILLIVMSIPFGYNTIQKVGHCILGLGYLTDYIVNKRWVE